MHDEAGRVLLLRHTYRPFAPLGLPSGCLKPGKSLADSIVREVREESGLVVEFEELLLVEAAQRPTRVDVWMRYRLVGGTASFSGEVGEAKFFTFDDLPQLLDSQRSFLDRYVLDGRGS